MRAPRFIYSNCVSECCGTKALLVRSRGGGFVSRNCLRCGKSAAYVGQNDLPDLECECCGTHLGVQIGRDKNYWYKCGKCGRKWELASVLPHWSELFQYCGLAAPGDEIFS
jgi:hypothetical protein